MIPPILAEVRRGEIVESVHRGHLCIIDGDGNRIAAVGEPETVTFFRSSAKPFQALPFITSGAADDFGFTEGEIALACASHSGEKIHVGIVSSMLEKTGFSEKDLHCGIHLPFNEKEAERMIREGEKPSQLHNNCSGKHAAMLAFAKHIRADVSNYESSANPVQIAITKAVSDFTGIPVDEIAIGIDGCAVPNFAIPVSAMARSFAGLVNPRKFNEIVKAACGRIVSAMCRFPHLIGGTERLDTMLMNAAPGKIISKVGADGVWLCGALPNEKYKSGLGIALKIEDGDDKLSRPVVAVDLLKHLEILEPDDLPDLSPMPIKNRRGDAVGFVKARVSLSI